jgi:hypothetical protein
MVSGFERKGVRGLVWLTFFAIVVLPFLSIAIAICIRSGIFRFDRPITDDQFKSLWTFMGAGLAAGATLLGALLTMSHNSRTLALQRETAERQKVAESEAAERLKLDSAISGLGLISKDGKYAPKASIAGGLATLVHLGHPVIAMRALSAALDDDAVDKDTAAWILGQVLTSSITTGTQDDLRHAKREAAALLRSYAPKLTFANLPGAFAWPNCVHGQWPSGLHPNAEANLAKALMRLLCSQDPSWWRDKTWVIHTLAAAVDQTVDDEVRREAAAYGRMLLEVVQDEWILGTRIPRPRAEIVELMDKVLPPGQLDPVLVTAFKKWTS